MAKTSIYRTLHATFWTGCTGQALQREGTAAQLLAAYLVTGPHANMIGLYFLPKAYIQADTGLTPAQIDAGLEALQRLEFAIYSPTERWVWVRRALHYQADYEGGIGKDKRWKGAIKLFEQAPPIIANQFASFYGSPFIAPPKPLGSPLQGVGGTETETETETETVLASSADDAPPRKAKAVRTTGSDIQRLLARHDELFRARYGDPAHYTGKDAKLAKSVLQTYGLERAEALLVLYFASDDPFYGRAGHAFPTFAACVTKLVAQGANGRKAATSPMVYDCRVCGGCHLGTDMTVCSKADGEVYHCSVCGADHQGHDERWCPVKQQSYDEWWAARFGKAVSA